MPMHRWIARAAGGTNQRLKPGRAMMRSFDRKPGALAKVPAATVLLIGLDPSYREGAGKAAQG
ncbi:hypothetical protein D3C75_928500 [compost metagenome]